ncbi:UDP-N-acetylmuramate--L-alanine ligase [Paeniglutamicibacter antarcticus]|uniref:UDP-N-acetylmuramate--L-alanine ligase n=1 Tax=Paeniglutamicibacter antarcticus TaxID=494023 RepID=A0ABP9TPR3_9MICC
MQELHSLQDLGNVHLLGIGGVGVSAVARLMLARGLAVSGTDAKELPVLDDLRAAGARIAVGYAAENLGDAETVVISSIIKAGNPEYDEAVSRGLRILHRSEGLASTMEGHRVIAVAGTHGKTTTTSLIAYMLRAAGISPTFAVGANIVSLGVNAEYGQGRVFVAEADESDASFLNYRPDVTVITNIEADHLDHYGSVEAVHQAFYEFASLLPESGLLICCGDDAGSQALAVRMRRERPDLRVQTYGFADDADRRLTDPHPRGNRFACSLEWGSGEEAELEIALPGNHNLLNAAAGFAVGLDCGLEPEVATAGLGAFTGAARRFDFRGEAAGVRVYDDYAHHPTEVQAALHAARAVAGEGSVHVLFQPHLFSRTQELHAGFAAALSEADSVHVLEIYPARESPIPGVTSELVTRGLTTAGGLVGRDEAAGVLADGAKAGDVIMTIGAGDVTEQAERILGVLEERQGS